MSTKLVVYCDNCTNYRHYNMTPSTGYGAAANAKREGWYIDDDGDALCPTCNMRQHGEEPGQAFTERAKGHT